MGRKFWLVRAACLLGLLVGLSFVSAEAEFKPGSGILPQPDQKFEEWVKKEVEKSWGALFRSISPLGAARGAIVASPSKVYPNYYFHWVRDASLAINEVVTLFERLPEGRERDQMKNTIADFVRFSRGNQVTPNLSGGLGEPKFGVDGVPYSLEWGRPQNDGPALRAISMTRFAWDMLAEGKRSESWVRERLYDSSLPSFSLIKNDLEFVSHHWMEKSFDLWEEVYANHFYTRLVQRRALLDGAGLADHLGDPGAADWYRRQAKLLEVELEKHWDEKTRMIQATLDSTQTAPNKDSNLDVAVLLAVLHGGMSDEFFSVHDDRVLATVQKIEDSFADLYEVNQDKSLGTAIGRYPEDVYDGYVVGKSKGNPWVLATAAYAEFYYKLQRHYAETGKIQINRTNFAFFVSLLGPRIPIHPGQVLKRGDSLFVAVLSELTKKGDGFLRRIQAHTPDDGGLSEQFNRLTGFMQGAYDLTWSYGGFLTAFWARTKVVLDPPRISFDAQ